jgi:hypothetical protein
MYHSLFSAGSSEFNAGIVGGKVGAMMGAVLKGVTVANGVSAGTVEICAVPLGAPADRQKADAKMRKNITSRNKTNLRKGFVGLRGTEPGALYPPHKLTNIDSHLTD